MNIQSAIKTGKTGAALGILFVLLMVIVWAIANVVGEASIIHIGDWMAGGLIFVGILGIGALIYWAASYLGKEGIEHIKQLRRT